MTKKIRLKGRMEANNSGWVSELLAADCEKAWRTSTVGRHFAAMVQLAVRNEEKDELKRMEVEHRRQSVVSSKVPMEVQDHCTKLPS